VPAIVDGTLESEPRSAGPGHHVRGSGSHGMVAAGAAVRLGRGGARDAPYDPAPVALLDARRVAGPERSGSAQMLARTTGHDRDDTAQPRHLRAAPSGMSEYDAMRYGVAEKMSS
jgi:hypothetical protein